MRAPAALAVLVVGLAIGAAGGALAVHRMTASRDAGPVAVSPTESPPPRPAGTPAAGPDRSSVAAQRDATTQPAVPVTPRYRPLRETGAPPPPQGAAEAIYRCATRGGTVYSDEPCAGGAVVVDRAANSGFESRPSDRLARLVADGRTTEVADTPAAGGAVRRRPAPESGPCASMRRQIRDIDAEALLQTSPRRLDELRAIRQDIRTTMARDRC